MVHNLFSVVTGIFNKPLICFIPNAITKLARSSESGLGATIFVTHSPCIECAKLIYQSGISTVYYKTSYRNDDGINFLKKSKVEVIKNG